MSLLPHPSSEVRRARMWCFIPNLEILLGNYVFVLGPVGGHALFFCPPARPGKNFRGDLVLIHKFLFPGLGMATKVDAMSYASWAPIFWPFLKSSARALTIKAVRGTVAIKGICGNSLGSCHGESVPLTGPSVPLTGGGSVPLTGLFNLFNCRFRAWRL